MKKFALAFAALAVLAPAAFADSTATPSTSTGAGQPSANATAMGVERATRNSNGGDRAQGGFGPAQSAYVDSIRDAGGNYGQTVVQDGGWTASATNGN